MRTELLKANGRDPRLIRRLLSDAQLCDVLKTRYQHQVAELWTFMETYGENSWAVIRESNCTGQNAPQLIQSVLSPFKLAIKKLKEEYDEGITALTLATQELIQLVRGNAAFSWLPSLSHVTFTNHAYRSLT